MLGTFVFMLTLPLHAAPKMPTTAEATQWVRSALQMSEATTQATFCTRGAMNCRTMYKTKVKATGQPARFFYDTFYSSDRQIGSTCYFVSVPDSTDQYYVFTDEAFDGQLEITRVSPILAKIRQDESGRWIFSNLMMPKIGTSQYLLGTLVEGEQEMWIEGVLKDSNDPSVELPLKIDYFRVRP